MELILRVTSAQVIAAVVKRSVAAVSSGNAILGRGRLSSITQGRFVISRGYTVYNKLININGKVCDKFSVGVALGGGIEIRKY